MSPKVEWPETTAPKAILSFLDTFFGLLDEPTDEASQEWSELFTENGAYLFSRTSQCFGRKGKSRCLLLALFQMAKACRPDVSVQTFANNETLCKLRGHI